MEEYYILGYSALGYIILVPLLVWGVGRVQKQAYLSLKKEPLLESVAGKCKKYLSFSLRDTRSVKGESPLTNKALVIILWFVGMLVAAIAPLVSYWLYLGSFIPAIIAIGFSAATAKPLMDARSAKKVKLIEIGRKGLGLPADADANPDKYVTVREWRDMIHPHLVEYVIPTSFPESSAENFMRHYNQIFGQELTWVPNYDGDCKGWDYENGRLYLRTVPPLPTIAPWSEHYVTHPSVHWGFFPIALGIEHGIELPNPETGDIENVLGYDVAGEQAKLSAKHNLKAETSRIVTAPMVLVAGGTGGGKAESAETPVLVKGNNSASDGQRR